MLNDTTNFSVSCDFPLKPNTGDSMLDLNNFTDAFIAWNKTSPINQSVMLPTPSTTGIKHVFFTISSADFILFNDERKTAIQANPQLYHIQP